MRKSYVIAGELGKAGPRSMKIVPTWRAALFGACFPGSGSS